MEGCSSSLKSLRKLAFPMGKAQPGVPKRSLWTSYYLQTCSIRLVGNRLRLALIMSMLNGTSTITLGFEHSLSFFTCIYAAYHSYCTVYFTWCLIPTYNYQFIGPLPFTIANEGRAGSLKCGRSSQIFIQLNNTNKLSGSYTTLCQDGF